VSTSKPVVVYGASGYTGRLICEYLREYNIPFVAAGRSADRVQAAMNSNVPGIETADYEVVEVDGSIESLTELFTGAKVVCNTVGPFARFGPAVVEACIAAGCHYVDTTGEQDWLMVCDEEYGERMAERGLLLSPGIAQMYTSGEIAANIALETPGLDTLDMLVLWKGTPTVASTQTIFVNAALSKAYYLEQNQYVEWPADGRLYNVAIPMQHGTGLALPWGGTSSPVWFKRDPRVANCKVLGGLFDQDLMQGVPAIVGATLEKIADMSEEEKLAVLSESASAVNSQMPPRENQRVNFSLDSVHATGPMGHVHVLLRGPNNYQQTGMLQAYAAYHLVHGTPLRVGFASACQAFGHRELLAQLQAFGLMGQPHISGAAATAPLQPASAAIGALNGAARTLVAS
jgi:short subunit dehydrogenase-like uncharacterized protein